MANRRSVLALIGLLAWMGTAWGGDVARYSSGLLRSFDASSGIVEKESAAFDRFVREHLSTGNEALAWRVLRENRDGTHVHRLYGLFQGNRRVLDQYALVHYRHGGWIDSANSTWRRKFSLASVPPDHAAARTAKSLLTAATPRLKSREAVVWIDGKTGTGRAALLLRMNGKGASREVVADARTGEVLEERRTARFLDVGSISIYTPSPDTGAVTNNTLRTNGTLYDLTDATKLVGPFFSVQRGRPSPQTSVDVKPNHAFTSDGAFTNDPNAYDGDCADGADTGCANQGFDAVNVYAHLSAFRRKLMTYLSQLGVTQIGTTTCASPPCFPADPLSVVANLPSLTSGGVTYTSNNAAYLSDCTSIGPDRCLVFFKPEAMSCSRRGGRRAEFYSIAREANVIVHEFQHYVTDAITSIAFSSTSTLNVGDALHEGYSDYFGASYATAAAEDPLLTPAATAEQIALGRYILGYSFQNCPELGARDLGTLRPFEVTIPDAAHYQVGQTWASGLWQLRGELGTAVMDLIAVKSLFYLTPTPNYIEAVEALVKADEALNAGANVARIRTLFYSELKFLGGQTGVFRDAANLVAEVGFQSCGAVGSAAAGRTPLSLSALLVWLTATLGLGRMMGRDETGGKS